VNLFCCWCLLFFCWLSRLQPKKSQSKPTLLFIIYVVTTDTTSYVRRYLKRDQRVN